MKSKDYPGLYQSADRASNSTQSAYIKAILFYILLLILSTILTQFAPKNSCWGIIAAVFMKKDFILMRITIME
ncbi:MAG: hypothetical protein KAT68_19160 [Bacteroidales bacterium]|nr:hypothetical protein [Bacteroidales bacterium]